MNALPDMQDVNMHKKLVLTIILTLMEQYNAQNHCKDIHQHVVSQGLHYIPGTNPCTLCVCDKGGPKWCKSVLCAPPQNCKSFQVGTLCCEFKCLDDILTVHDDDTYDVALRFIASAVTAILSLSLLFFLFQRLKRRKVLVHQNQQLSDDRRSLNSIGYITGSLGYLPENIGGYLRAGNSHEVDFHYEESNAQYSLWKPPGNYFPRGEAPPPYEEAVRTAQLESNMISSQICTTESLRCINHLREASGANTSNMASLAQEISAESEGPSQQYANVIVEDVTVHNTSEPPKTDSSRYRNDRIRPHSVPTINQERAYENIPLTITKCSSKRERAISKGGRNKKMEGNEHKFKIDKYDVIVQYNKVQPNLEKAERYQNTEGIAYIKSIDSDIRRSRRGNAKEAPIHRTLPKNLRELLVNTERIPNDVTEADVIVHDNPMRRSHTSAYDILLSDNNSVSKSHGHSVAESEISEAVACVSPLPPAPPDFASSSKQVKNNDEEEQLSLISYQCLSSSQDDEDYRSECENCKSSGFTLPDDEQNDILSETMTLHRRPLESEEEVPYYRTSLTLPTSTRKSRAAVTNANREAWFTSMQETSSSDEDA